MKAGVHSPVLTDEVIERLAVEPGGRYIDCTLGAGGHARLILEAGAPGAMLLGIDADPHAVALARHNLEDFDGDVHLVNTNFRELEKTARELTFVPVHGVLFDLGISSMQLAEDGRGFSFQTEAALDMRFSPEQELTAADIINGYDESEIANLIWEYGEERFSRRIAKAIVRSRPLQTTTALASIVAKAVPGRGKINPATKTFQALRIAVNDELTALVDGLDVALRLLRRGGRIVVISYHSLEDRIVKRRFASGARGCECPPDFPVCVCDNTADLRLLTRRPEVPDVGEIERNPRARSAKLRAAESLT